MGAGTGVVPDKMVIEKVVLNPHLDARTFATPGARTTGTKAGTFAISGPNWTGTLPAGMRELKSPTNMVWILGRTQTN